MQCLKCGAAILDGARFCIKCGSPVVESSVSTLESGDEDLSYEEKLKLLKNHKHVIFKLTGIKKKTDEWGGTRRDNLFMCDVGDEVEIEQDYETDKYVVSCGSEIGELSKASEEVFLDEYEDQEYVAFITEVDSDDDSPKVKIAVVSMASYDYPDVNIVGAKYIDGADKATKRLNIGDTVLLRAEPENQYDKNAIVVISADGSKLGYIAKGKIQDMIHDFWKKECLVSASVSSVNNKGVSVRLIFQK